VIVSRKIECSSIQISDLVATKYGKPPFLFGYTDTEPANQVKLDFSKLLIAAMMNQSDINASIENVCQHSDKEPPPFALEENLPSRKEYDHDTFNIFSEDDSISDPSQSDMRCLNLNSTEANQIRSSITFYSQNSSPSTPPDLVESVITDGTSCCSALSASNLEVTKSINCHVQKTSPATPPSVNSTQTSSFFSAVSLNDIPLESAASICLPDINIRPLVRESIEGSSQTVSDSHMIISQPKESSCSFGFSELMRAADGSSIQLAQSRNTTTNLSERKSNVRFSPLLENQELESGVLISAAPEYNSTFDTTVRGRMRKDRKWWHDIPLVGLRPHIANRELDAPLLTMVAGTNSYSVASSQPDITRILSNTSSQHQHANLAFDRAIASVQTKIESDDSFEVSLLLGENSRCTVDDVMEVVSNTDLLSLWCDSIGTLIVTSNSSHSMSSDITVDETRKNVESGGFRDGNERTREYEGEWIEATTSALESPSSSFSFILSMGQSILESLGCASYGRITMFTERKRGHVALTVGPFHGGIYASHSIYVSSEVVASNSRRIRIVDRVRLTHDDDDDEAFSIAKMFGCPVVPGMSQCFFPSIVGYVGQVATSMAQLCVLLESNERTMSTNRACC